MNEKYLVFYYIRTTMKKIIVALCLCCLLVAGCLEEQPENIDFEKKEEGGEKDQEMVVEEQLHGQWNKIEGETELCRIGLAEKGGAIVYFGCSCPGNKENAQWSIVGNYIDIAAESRTQRYIYKLENETLYLRTLTEETFSTFDK